MKTKPPTKMFTLIAPIVLFAALAAPAHADVQKGTGEIGIDIGFTEFDTVPGGAGPRFAFRAGYFFTDVIGIEGMISHSNSSDNGALGLQNPVDSNQVRSELTAAYANIVVNVPHKRNLIPYFLVGIGGAQLDVGFDDDTGISAQTLGGARFYGQKGKFGFRLEGGFQWVDTFDDTSVHWGLNLGFTWTIGGPHPHEKPSGRLGY